MKHEPRIILSNLHKSLTLFYFNNLLFIFCNRLMEEMLQIPLTELERRSTVIYTLDIF